jgi:hypothetical protein
VSALAARVALAAFAAASLTSCGPRGASAAPAGPRLQLRLPALDGGVIDFASFRGEPLLVHVFTTWAMPAQDDAERIARSFGPDSGLAVVGVALDLEGARVVAPWRRAMEVAYLIALGTDEVRAGRSVLGDASQVPFTLLYDAGGRLLRRWNAPLGDSGIAEIRRLIGR